VTVLSKEQPYPGLRPYDSGDEEFFFGREAQTSGLRRKLETSRLVAVVGRSGCGKSSLVRAGLVPLLNRERDPSGQPEWHIISFRPHGRRNRHRAIGASAHHRRSVRGDFPVRRPERRQ